MVSKKASRHPFTSLIEEGSKRLLGHPQIDCVALQRAFQLELQDGCSVRECMHGLQVVGSFAQESVERELSRWILDQEYAFWCDC